jgi:hypothetical protein
VNTHASDGNALTAKAPRASHTYLGDWTWMSDAPDYALRVYACVRAFIFDKDPDSVAVQLTDEEIAALTNRSESAAKRARKSCYAHGLLWEVSRYTEHLPPKTPGGRPRARTVRTLGVALEPPEEFTGPANCYAELKRLRREAEARGGSDLTPHTDQEQQDGVDVSAGQCEGSNSVEGRSNLTEARSNLLHSAPHDQGEQRPQVLFQVPLQPTKGSGDDGGSMDGWLEATPKEESGSTTQARARSLLDALVMPHGPQYEPRQADINNVTAALDAGVPEKDVRAEIMSGIAGAERPAATVKGRCEGLWRLYSDHGRESGSQSSSASMPEWCGQCEGERPAERFRENADGARVKCRCHPGHPSRQRPAAPPRPSAADQADPAGVLAQLGLTG